jgi:hypothetical protein
MIVNVWADLVWVQLRGKEGERGQLNKTIIGLACLISALSQNRLLIWSFTTALIDCSTLRPDS